MLLLQVPEAIEFILVSSAGYHSVGVFRKYLFLVDMPLNWMEASVD